MRATIFGTLLAVLLAVIFQGSPTHTVILFSFAFWLGVPLTLFLALWIFYSLRDTGKIEPGLLSALTFGALFALTLGLSFGLGLALNH